MRLRPRFSFVVGFVLWAFSLAANAETVLITGANAGIGLEFAKQYAMRGSTVMPRTVAIKHPRHSPS